MSKPARVRCKAKTQAGKKCQKWAMENGRCSKHGGKNGTGVDSPRIVHGLRQSDPAKTMAVPGGRKATGLPTRFYDFVMGASEDPNLTSLFDELLIVDSRIADLISRIDTGESGSLWVSLQNAVGEYRKESDDKVKKDLLFSIFGMIEAGSTDHQAWLDINMNIDQKTKLLRAETQMMKDKEMLIRADRVLLLVRAVVEVVMRNVPDPDQQEKIRIAVGKLLDRPEVNLHGGL